MGWMLGPLMIVGALQFGAAIVFIEGLPDFPVGQPAVADRRAQPRHGSGHRADRGARPARRDRRRARRPQDISSLRAFASTGEAWDEPTWHWLFETVGQTRLPILNYYGRHRNRRRHPVVLHDRAACRRPLLRARCRAWTSTCSMPTASPRRASANSCMHNTWPGMTHAFWRDPDRYLDTYWSRWHGHLGARRSRQRRCRRLLAHPWPLGRHDQGRAAAASARPRSSRRWSPTRQVAEAAVIGVPDQTRAQRIVAFVTLKDGAGACDADRGRSAAVTQAGGQGDGAVGGASWCPGLPKTKNGKIMRRAIRARFLGEPAGRHVGARRRDATRPHPGPRLTGKRS